MTAKRKGLPMADTTMDRRIARTRASLRQALMSLIREKGYDAISVADICRVADVGRSTFYAHFASKDDLKRSGIDQLRRQLVGHGALSSDRAGTAKADALGFSLPMFEHARDHRDLYDALVGDRGGAVALGAIRGMLAELVRDELGARAGKKSSEPIPRELAVQYVVGAYMAVLTWWLDGGAKVPAERIDAMFRRLASEGLSAA